MDGVNALRQEIVETSAQVLGLAKWKLVVAAAIGAVALGLNGAAQPAPVRLLEPFYLLCLVPLVCLYCDMLLLNGLIRIKAIGLFLAAEKPEMLVVQYERRLRALCDEHRGGRNVFELERWAVQGATLVLSAVVALCALADNGSWWFMVFGLGGMVGDLLLHRRYRANIDDLREQMAG